MSPVPAPIATARTAARSIPKRAPAAATNATWTATVTSAKPPWASWRPSSSCTPKAASTPDREADDVRPGAREQRALVGHAATRGVPAPVRRSYSR